MHFHNDHHDANSKKDGVSKSYRINSNFWYKDDTITSIIKKYLENAGLHITGKESGLILNSENKLHLISESDDNYSISLGQPILIGGGSQSWEAGLVNDFYKVINEILRWNQQQLEQNNVAKLITKHTIVCPLDLANAHWTTLIIDFDVLRFENENRFHVSPKISVTLFDSLSIARKINENVLDALLRTFDNTLPEKGKIKYEFDTPYVPDVQQQTDHASCGVITTESIRRVIFSEPPMIITDENPKRFLTVHEVLDLRANHIKLLGPEFAEVQLSRGTTVAERARQGDYVLSNKQLDDPNNIPKVIYDCLQSMEAKERDEVYAKITEFMRAFHVLESLNREGSTVKQDDPELKYFSETYKEHYEEHKRKHKETFKEDFVENSHEALFICANYAYREVYLPELKRWFIKNYDALQTIWTSFFRTGKDVANPDDLEWADNGKDKFADALQILIECKKTNSIPVKRKSHDSFLPGFHRSEQDYARLRDTYKLEQAKEGRRYAEYSETIEQLDLTANFKGWVNLTGKPMDGRIACLLGAGFKEYQVAIGASIYNGFPIGSIVLRVYSRENDAYKPKFIISAGVVEQKIEFKTSDAGSDFNTELKEYCLANLDNFKFNLDTKPNLNMVASAKDGLSDTEDAVKADEVKEPLKLEFIGERDAEYRPVTGIISCVIGNNTSAKNFVAYNGHIEGGRISGIGTISIHHESRLEYYLTGNFKFNELGNGKFELYAVNHKNTNIKSVALENAILGFVADNCNKLLIKWAIPNKMRVVPLEPDILTGISRYERNTAAEIAALEIDRLSSHATQDKEANVTAIAEEPAYASVDKVLTQLNLAGGAGESVTGSLQQVLIEVPDVRQTANVSLPRP